MTVDAAGLRAIAAECVKLVTAEFDRNLDWRLESLETLDEVCAHLLSAGPLNADRHDLWWKLVGTYVGEVVLAANTETVSAFRTCLPRSLRSYRHGGRRGQMSRAAGGTA